MLVYAFTVLVLFVVVAECCDFVVVDNVKHHELVIFYGV